MNSNVILPMKGFATLSKSKSVILFMSKYANLPSLAMVVDLEAVEVAVEVVVEAEQEADMVLQQPQLADKFQDKNAEVFQESSVTMCQDSNAQMFQDSNARMYPEKPAEMSQDKSREKTVRMFRPSSAQLCQ